MSNNEYLFPLRQTRRDFLYSSAAIAAGTAWSGAAYAADEKPVEKPAVKPAEKPADKAPVIIGSGKYTFTLDPAWGVLPTGMKYGFGCAIVVDAKDRIFVTSRSENPCVAIFDCEGKLLETWSNDFAENVGYDAKKVAATAHGLYWSKEGNDEFLYFTENVAGKDSEKFGKRVYKTDLKGKILYQLGPGVANSATSQKFDFVNPTDVAVAPNGDIYIVDGYGSQLVHRFDKNFKLIKTMGGKGAEHGKFNTCHGVWVSTLKPEPEVYIADLGANNRLEVYSLELDYKRTISDVRNPCCFYQHAGHLYVPELGARVSILDKDDNIVARLGDGKGIDKAKIEEHPDKFATPHALTLDSHGDLFVLEWLPYGRVRKFKHTPMA